VIKILTKALEISPKHKQAAECMFLIGYASFMEEKFADAVTWLRRLNDTFPGNPQEADATYWTGMALMFDRKFEEAAKEFDRVLASYPDCIYVQDTMFRRAICEHGLSKFDTAEPMFEKFIAKYPESKLCGEAYMLLGDISGVFGEIKKAVLRYREVARFEINIEFYNYSAFRCAELLEELSDFKGLVRDMQDYIAQNREGANVPLAMFWEGKALWSLGEQRGALEYFRDGIAKYGVDRKSLGIDLIIEEWIGRSRAAAPDVAESAWKDMRLLLDKADKAKQDALVLRLKRMFLYRTDITEEEKKAALDDLTQEENIPKASPGVLELMLDTAAARGDTNLAVRVAEATIKEFTETDYALSARVYLSRVAISRQDYKTAIKHLTVIREVFATSGEAAEALMLLGELYIKQNKYSDADECYKSVLGVRDWRGPLWPAALYGRGECSRLQRNFEQASAYYERIYLMYGQYRDWTAKAYLARSDCLVRLRQYQKASETLTEMVASKELQDLPEMAEARKKLDELKTKGL
jgi:TolA-binding protein